MQELVFFRRGEEVLCVALERPRMGLGRAEDNDIVIPDPHVSRYQAALRQEGARWVLEDMSDQGTLVDGKRLQRCVLREGRARCGAASTTRSVPRKSWGWRAPRCSSGSSSGA